MQQRVQIPQSQNVAPNYSKVESQTCAFCERQMVPLTRNFQRLFICRLSAIMGTREGYPTLLLGIGLVD